jgi:ketosteroid isomerase-like protein
MGPQEMKDATRRFMTAVFDRGDFGVLDEMTTEDYTFSIARPGTIPRQDFPEAVGEFRSTFSSVRNTFEEQVVEGTVVVTRGTSHVTQPAPSDDPDSTEKQASVPWVVFTRFDGDRISEQYEVWDELGLLHQLGAITEPE